MIDFGEEHVIFIYLIIVVVVNFGEEGVCFFFLILIFKKVKYWNGEKAQLSSIGWAIFINFINRKYF
jgi:hypothetical protein